MFFFWQDALDEIDEDALLGAENDEDALLLHGGHVEEEEGQEDLHLQQDEEGHLQEQEEGEDGMVEVEVPEDVEWV